MEIEVIRFGEVQGDTIISKEAAVSAAEKLRNRGTLVVDAVEQTIKDVRIMYNRQDMNKGTVVVVL